MKNSQLNRNYLSRERVVFTLQSVYKVLNYVLAGILLLAGVTKMYDASGLIVTLQELSFLGSNTQVLIATLLPLAELSLAAALYMNWKPSFTLGCTTALFAGFLGVSIYGFTAGWAADCGCFGGLAESSFGWGMVVRNGIFLSLSIAVLVIYYTSLRKRD